MYVKYKIYVKYNLIRSFIVPLHIKQDVFCFLIQFPQNVCPHGTIAVITGSVKQIVH